MTIFSRTLAQIRSSVQSRWQLENSPDIGDGTTAGKATLNEMINDALLETTDILVQKWADYFTTQNTFVTVAAQDTYDLQVISTANDFYKLRKLEIQQGSRWLRLLPHDLEGAHHFVATSATWRKYRYRIQNASLVLVPAPVGVDTLRLYYVKSSPQLVADGDVVTFPVPVAFKLLLAIVGRDVLDRQELDPSAALSRIQQYTAQLKTAADGLDASEPFYINEDGPSTGSDGYDWDGWP